MSIVSGCLGESEEANYEADGGDGENDETSVDDEADRENDDPESLANQWFTDQKIKREIDERLKQSGSDTEAMFAKAFVGEIEALGVIESLLVSAEFRRNNALHEIEGRRNVLGHALRETSDRIIEGEAPLVPLAAK